MGFFGGGASPTFQFNGVSAGPFPQSRVVPFSWRAPRACLQGDAGGERVLQKKWTTFLKAQLSCSLPDDGFPFNVIQDVFVLTPGPHAWKETTFYGVFTSQW